MAHTALKKLIDQVDFLNFKEGCASPIDAFNYLQKNSIDLVFLDIEMPGMSGIELVKNLPIDKRPIIILITAKTEYAVEAFELNVADYIVKPVTLPRLLTALAKAKELFDSKEQKIELNEKEYIFVRSNAVLTKIKINEITYMQALGDYVNIFTNDKRYTVHITLKGMEENLSPDKFYRLHRSYLIALDHIDKIEEGTAFIGKHPIPIGEQFKKDLLKKLNLI
ncbi:MAG: LytR/AlgR family response regulator transcription factor [Bacteroidia bacterium]